MPTTSDILCFGPSSASLTVVTASVGSLIALQTGSLNPPLRRGLTIFNDSPNIMFVRFGPGALSNAYSFQLAALTRYESYDPWVYTGIVTATWGAASGSGYFTQLF